MNAWLKITQKIFSRLNWDETNRKQAHLLLDLKQGGLKISKYLINQEKINILHRKDSIQIGWGKLKEISKSAYEHEKKHLNIWEKYNIKAKLYQAKGVSDEFFVVSENFKEVSKNRSFTIDKIVSILKEVTHASFAEEKRIDHRYNLDVLFYEILNGSITELNLRHISNALKKYNWDYN